MKLSTPSLSGCRSDRREPRLDACARDSQVCGRLALRWRVPDEPLGRGGARARGAHSVSSPPLILRAARRSSLTCRWGNRFPRGCCRGRDRQPRLCTAHHPSHPRRTGGRAAPRSQRPGRRMLNRPRGLRPGRRPFRPRQRRRRPFRRFRPRQRRRRPFPRFHPRRRSPCPRGRTASSTRQRQRAVGVARQCRHG